MKILRAFYSDSIASFICVNMLLFDKNYKHLISKIMALFCSENKQDSDKNVEEHNRIKSNEFSVTGNINRDKCSRSYFIRKILHKIDQTIVPNMMPKSIEVLLMVKRRSTFRRNIPAKRGNMQYPKIATD